MAREILLPLTENSILDTEASPSSRFTPRMLQIRKQYRRLLPEEAREKMYMARHTVARFLEVIRSENRDCSVMSVTAFDVTGRFHIENTPGFVHTSRLGYEEEFMGEFMGALKEDDVVFDVGAAQGIYSIFTGLKFPGISIVAFEPYGPYFKELEENVRENGLGNVVLKNVAVSNRCERRGLFNNGPSGVAPSARNINGKFKNMQETEFATLDILVERGVVQAPDVIKIDTEGAESDILEGAKELLRERKIRDLFVEMHPTMIWDFETDPTTMWNKVLLNGYKIVSARMRGETNILVHATRY